MTSHRTIAITGGATGIGGAAATRLRDAGYRVITVGIMDSEVIADLSTPAGRQAAIDGVLERCGGKLDGYIASAGLSRNSGNEEKVMAVNFFGTFIPLIGLRDALAKGDRPGVALVSSWGSMRPNVIPAAIEACLKLDETTALALVSGDKFAAGPLHERMAYATSKAAMNRYARYLAWQPEWAEAGITINVVAPAVTRTPMTDVDFQTPEGAARLLKAAPSPMNRIADPDEIADILCFFVEGRGRFISGQVIFADGGLDARRRPDDPIQPLAAERWT